MAVAIFLLCVTHLSVFRLLEYVCSPFLTFLSPQRSAYIFGGCRGVRPHDPYSNLLLQFDFQTQTLHALTSHSPRSSPSTHSRPPLPRCGHGLVYRTRGRDRGPSLVLFGGCLSGQRQFDNTLYEFTFSPAPPDSANRNRPVSRDGNSEDEEDEEEDDSLVIDSDRDHGSWRVLESAMPPPGMAFFRCLYLAASDLLIAFGGCIHDARTTAPPPGPGRGGGGAGVSPHSHPRDEEREDAEPEYQIKPSNSIFVFPFQKNRWFNLKCTSEDDPSSPHFDVNLRGNGSVRGIPCGREDFSMDWIGDDAWAKGRKSGSPDMPLAFIVFGGVVDLAVPTEGGGGGGRRSNSNSRRGRKKKKKKKKGEKREEESGMETSATSSFGGNGEVIRPFRAFNDTWTFSLSKRQWKLLVPGTTQFGEESFRNPNPPPRFGHASFVSYGALYIHGGIMEDGTVLHDVWRLSLVSKKWTRLRTEFLDRPRRMGRNEGEREAPQAGAGATAAVDVDADSPLAPEGDEEEEDEADGELVTGPLVLRSVRGPDLISLAFHCALLWEEPRAAPIQTMRGQIIPPVPGSGGSAEPEEDFPVVIFGGYDGRNPSSKLALMRVYIADNPLLPASAFVPSFNLEDPVFVVDEQSEIDSERRRERKRERQRERARTRLTVEDDFPNAEQINDVVLARTGWLLENAAFEIVLQFRDISVPCSRLFLVNSRVARKCGLYESSGKQTLTFPIDCPFERVVLLQLLAGATVQLDYKRLAEMFLVFDKLGIPSFLRRICETVKSVPEIATLLELLYNSLCLFEQELIPRLRRESDAWETDEMPPFPEIAGEQSVGEPDQHVRFEKVFSCPFTVAVMNALDMRRDALRMRFPFLRLIERMGLMQIWEFYRPLNVYSLNKFDYFRGFEEKSLYDCFKGGQHTNLELRVFPLNGNWTRSLRVHIEVLALRSEYVFSRLRKNPAMKVVEMQVPDEFLETDVDKLIEFYYVGLFPIDQADRSTIPLLIRLLRFADFANEGSLRRLILDLLLRAHTPHLDILAEMGSAQLGGIFGHLSVDEQHCLRITWERKFGDRMREGIAFSERLHSELRSLVRKEESLRVDAMKLEARTRQQVEQQQDLRSKRDRLRAELQQLESAEAEATRKRKRRDDDDQNPRAQKRRRSGGA